LDETHLSRYSIHPRITKMYQDLKQHNWWTKMKIEIARYVAKCVSCNFHRNEMIVCHWQNFPIITSIMKALKWHHLKHCTGDDAEHP
jgi:hypothetical protein